MRLSHRRKRDHKYKVRRHAWKSKQARAARTWRFYAADSVALQTIRADRFAAQAGEALAALGRDFRRRMGDFITKMPCHEEVERFPMFESSELRQERAEVRPVVKFHNPVVTSGRFALSDEDKADIAARCRARLADWSGDNRVRRLDLMDDCPPVEPPRSLWARLKDKFRWKREKRREIEEAVRSKQAK
ncbi:hypothetical protein [Vibrio furnissii]|uniref:hypothetical protein n=1 Tax=Vibrio furnissii TaxID=29494 RepID=UPI001EEA19B8|nr:hypothetical protein [Vibrio furnissii]MCG6268296.1 hypothetical protein [Vibrio furnissii]